MELIKIGETTDTLNLNDDQPEFLFGLEVDGKLQEGAFPPFYVILNIHDKILHNGILEIGRASCRERVSSPV